VTTFSIDFLRVVEGEKFSVPVNSFTYSNVDITNSRRQIFYRISGDISNSDIRGSRLSGVIRLNKNLEGYIPIEFIDDGRKEASEKVGIVLSTDKTFSGTPPQGGTPGDNRFFRVLDAPSVKRDLITGIQDSDRGPRSNDFTFGLYSTNSSSEFSNYYGEYKLESSKINIFADSNRNGGFDKKDAFLSDFKITSLVNTGEFMDGVPRTFEYRQNTGEFLLKYGGRTYLEALGDTDLF
jgi:hypothetical protein